MVFDSIILSAVFLGDCIINFKNKANQIYVQYVFEFMPIKKIKNETMF